MKKTTATTALAATIGLSAWTMTAAFAVAPAPAPADPAPVAAPAEASPEDVQAPLEDGIVDESGATAPAAEEIVIPDWARDLAARWRSEAPDPLPAETARILTRGLRSLPA